MVRYYISLLVLFITVPFCAFAFGAQSELSPMRSPNPNGGCNMQETANVSINFNSMETDLASIQGKMDAKIKEVQALSKQIGLEKLNISNMSYSVNPQTQYGGTQYMVSGNLNFAVTPASKGLTLMTLLSKNGFTPNLNVNMYNNGGVGCPIDNFRTSLGGLRDDKISTSKE